MRNRKIRGEGRLGAIVGLAVFASIIYIAFKIIPVLVRTYDFEDKLENIIRRSTATYGTTVESLRADIMVEAKRLTLPIRPEDVHVSQYGKVTEVEIRYTVTVQFPGYTWRSEQHPKASSTRY